MSTKQAAIEASRKEESRVDLVFSLCQLRLGANVKLDHHRGKITHLVIYDLANLPEGRTPRVE